jgi:hypothetical protein
MVSIAMKIPRIRKSERGEGLSSSGAFRITSSCVLTATDKYQRSAY